MERMQIYLAGDQRMRLAAIARRQRRPVAELVREAVTRFLAAEEGEISDDDGLLRLVGAGAGLERARDVARRHHHYLREPHWKKRDR